MAAASFEDQDDNSFGATPPRVDPWAPQELSDDELPEVRDDDEGRPTRSQALEGVKVVCLTFPTLPDEGDRRTKRS
jgi:hypothetical protein